MSRLVDRDIRARCGSNPKTSLIYPFDKDSLQPCSYDLHLAGDYMTELPVDKPVGLGEKPWERHTAEDVIELKPGQFILGSTIERVSIGLYLSANVNGRSSWGRMGIIVHATAGFVDPGFSGQITLEIKNISDITTVVLPVGEAIAQISFDQLTRSPESRYGDTALGSLYQGQEGPTPAAPPIVSART